MKRLRLAILVPCYNEALTVQKVVKDFLTVKLPKEISKCDVYVYDNNSDDETCSLAENAGAIVRKESRQFL